MGRITIRGKRERIMTGVTGKNIRKRGNSEIRRIKGYCNIYRSVVEYTCRRERDKQGRQGQSRYLEGEVALCELMLKM